MTNHQLWNVFKWYYTGLSFWPLEKLPGAQAFRERMPQWSTKHAVVHPSRCNSLVHPGVTLWFEAILVEGNTQHSCTRQHFLTVVFRRVPTKLWSLSLCEMVYNCIFNKATRVFSELYRHNRWIRMPRSKKVGDKRSTSLHTLLFLLPINLGFAADAYSRTHHAQWTHSLNFNPSMQ